MAQVLEADHVLVKQPDAQLNQADAAKRLKCSACDANQPMLYRATSEVKAKK